MLPCCYLYTFLHHFSILSRISIPFHRFCACDHSRDRRLGSSRTSFVPSLLFYLSNSAMLPECHAVPIKAGWLPSKSFLFCLFVRNEIEKLPELCCVNRNYCNNRMQCNSIQFNASRSRKCVTRRMEWVLRRLIMEGIQPGMAQVFSSYV